MRVEALDWCQAHAVGPQARVTLTSMQHWSARGLFDRREALWAAGVDPARFLLPKVGEWFTVRPR